MISEWKNGIQRTIIQRHKNPILTPFHDFTPESSKWLAKKKPSKQKPFIETRSNLDQGSKVRPQQPHNIGTVTSVKSSHAGKQRISDV